MKTHRFNKLVSGWMLILIMLMMPLLSLWVTPYVHGEQVYLCTLQGMQAFSLGPDEEIIALQNDSNSEQCNALNLAKAFSQGVQFNPPLNIRKIYQTPIHTHIPPVFFTPLFLSYNSQAPPYLLASL